MSIDRSVIHDKSREDRMFHPQANLAAVFGPRRSKEASAAEMRGDIESAARYESSPADLDREDDILSSHRRQKDRGDDA